MVASKNKAKFSEVSFSFPTQAFIGGQFTNSSCGETFPVINPRDSSQLADVTHCKQQDVDRAVKIGREVFESGVWSRKPLAERKSVLLSLADLLEKKADEFAWLECVDTGKPLEVAKSDDMPGAISTLRWYAEAVDKLYDESISPTSDVVATITREPIGVVGAVLAWNFPLSLLIWKVAPALMMGNSIIIKPSEKTPLTALKLCEFVEEAGLPEGVLSVLPGLGETTGQALGRHPDIDCITFTGSSEIGKKFLTYAGESNMKRISLEGGGKSANLLLPDYFDLQRFASVSAAEIFYNQGEVCSALSRMIIPVSKKVEIERLMVEEANSWQPSDPLSPDCQMGAIIDQVQHDRIMHFIQMGKEEGATLLCGGNSIPVVQGGYYIEPTIFTDVKPHMKIAQEEIFGPVLSIMTYENNHIEEAILLANSTKYGLASCLWTENVNHIHHYARLLKAGSVTVNGTSMVSPYTPFGGYKQSGVGRDLSLHAFEKYCELKSTIITLSS